jgi:hypothetical protein
VAVHGWPQPMPKHDAAPKRPRALTAALGAALRLLATGLALGAAAAGSLWADPFASDRVPTFTVSETYAETIASFSEDGYTDYWVEPSRANSKLAIAAKLSSTGINLAAVDELTPVSISVGDFSFEATLGDAEGWRPGLTSAVFPLTAMDPDTFDDINVGSVVVKWGGGYITYTVNVADPADFAMIAPVYAGEENEAYGVNLTTSLVFGDRSMDERYVYLTVDSTVNTRLAGKGDDVSEYDLASVRVRGGIDSTKPRVAFDSSVAGVVATDHMDVSGTASDNIGVDHLNVQVNDGEIQTVAAIDGHWILSGAGLQPGANTIRAQAVDFDGNESAWLSSTVRYLTPLVVTKSGEGTLSAGFLGTSLRTPGAALTVKAVPAAGYLFHDWSGSVSSTSPSLTFTMGAGMSLQANFIPNPFPAVRGGYTGLVTGSGPTGSMAYSLLASGAFTAKLKLDNVAYSLSGSLNADGVFHGSIPRAHAAALAVDLALDFATGALAGTIADGANVSELSAERSLFDVEGSVPMAGRYTLLLPAGAASAALPAGDGSATVTVDARGAAVFTGVLGDGAVFTATATVTQTGALFVQTAPYAGTGALEGRLTFADVPGVSDFDGVLRWVKPASTGFYPAGFETTVDVVGSEYVAPATGALLLSLPAATGNVLAGLGAGDLRAWITKTATLAAGGRFTVTNPGADRLAVTFNSATGYLSGTFIDPSTGASRTIKGAVLQKQNIAAGVFRGVKQAGFFRLSGN